MRGVRVRLLGFFPRDVCVLASYARLSVGGVAWSVVGRGACLGWLRLVILHGYTSVLEHAVYSFEAVCSRVCSHQLVRHRLASYTQQSLRRTRGLLDEAAEEACRLVEGCRGPDGYADALEKLAEAAHDAPEEACRVLSRAYNAPCTPTVLEALAHATAAYYRCLDNNHPEECRYILPQATLTRIAYTMNARELLETFLPLRMCRKAHHEIRQLAWKTWLHLLHIHPEIFTHAGPRCILQAQRTLQKPLTIIDALENKIPEPIHCPEGKPANKIPDCIEKAAEEAGIPIKQVRRQLEDALRRIAATPVARGAAAPRGVV